MSSTKLAATALAALALVWVVVAGIGSTSTSIASPPPSNTAPLPAPITTTATATSSPARTTAVTTITTTTVPSLSAVDQQAVTDLAAAAADAELTAVGRDRFPELWPATPAATITEDTTYADAHIVAVDARADPDVPGRVDAFITWTAPALELDPPEPLAIVLEPTPSGWRPVAP